jgi:1-phosphatidylinositol-3-phosphate 5-kinase
MRVCLKCLEIVNEYQDTESDSDEYANSIYPTANGSDGIVAGNAGFNMSTDHKPTSTPLMAIPATRRTAANNPNRRSQILEISEVPSPPRPPSVRSGKVSLGGIRPITAGSVRQPHHKHTYSRSYHRWPGMSPNKSERAPFHGNAAEEISGRNRLTGFHNDQVIDPELAPYMSDPGDSEEEHPSIFSVIAPRFVDTNGKPISTPSGGNGGDKTPASPGGSISNAFVAARARSKHIRSTSGSISNMLSLAIGGSGSDVAGSVSRSATHTKTRKRNSSFATTLHPRPATRGSKSHWPGMRKDQQPELAESQSEFVHSKRPEVLIFA